MAAMVGTAYFVATALISVRVLFGAMTLMSCTIASAAGASETISFSAAWAFGEVKNPSTSLNRLVNQLMNFLLSAPWSASTTVTGGVTPGQFRLATPGASADRGAKPAFG